MEAKGKQWNIIQTRDVHKHKTSDGAKYINNYALLRTLGHGSFAKVKLCERMATATPPPPIGATDSQGPPTFAPPAPRRQFAMKIFSKKILTKMKDYVTKKEHDGVYSRPDENTLASLDAAALPPLPAHVASSMRVVTALDRVRDEIQIMRSLYHRNIVLLFEVIEAAGSDMIYMVMEYMPQGPCMVFRPGTQDFVSPITQSTPSEELARSHLLDILNGLQYLHGRGICHRDLKVGHGCCIVDQVSVDSRSVTIFLSIA
jgi:[calcium/calmodulin-dependent protein kinase] kinase